jgi:hypothetical protein
MTGRQPPQWPNLPPAGYGQPPGPPAGNVPPQWPAGPPPPPAGPLPVHQPPPPSGLSEPPPTPDPEHRLAPGGEVPRDRGALVAGIVIAGIGLFLLLAQLVPDTGTWIPLAVGLVFLAAALYRREYGFLVPGGIIGGVGVGVLLQQALDEPWSGAIMLLSIAAGFASVWVLGRLMRLPENHPWPLIPASIVALVAGVQLADADVDGVMRGWPIIIIALGFIIIGSTLVRRR